MLSGIAIAVLVILSVAFVGMTGAAIVNVVILAVSGQRRRGRQEAITDAEQDVEQTDPERSSS